MKDTDLHNILKSVEPPARPDEYWGEFPNQVARQLNRPLPPTRQSREWLPHLTWAGGFAVLLVTASFLVGRHFGHKDLAENNGQLLQNEKLISEVTSMFPNRVRAIVKDESGLQIILSDTEDVPMSTPLWVKICKGKLCTTLVTFSGQEVEVAGQRMTVLADGENGVILVGDRFAWASDERNTGVKDLKIQARPLQLASK